MDPHVVAVEYEFESKTVAYVHVEIPGVSVVSINQRSYDRVCRAVWHILGMLPD